MYAQLLAIAILKELIYVPICLQVQIVFRCWKKGKEKARAARRKRKEKERKGRKEKVKGRGDAEEGSRKREESC